MTKLMSAKVSNREYRQIMTRRDMFERLRQQNSFEPVQVFAQSVQVFQVFQVF